MEALIWLLAPLLALLGLYALSRARGRRRTLAQYKEMPSSGGYNPLQEMVEPAKRHVVQVNEHVDRVDDVGAGDR
jgi:hypothetical protein